MFKRLVIKGKVDWGFLPFWLGLHVEQYGCQGLGHHGWAIALELGFIEFMLSIGKRFVD